MKKMLLSAAAAVLLSLNFSFAQNTDPSPAVYGQDFENGTIYSPERLVQMIGDKTEIKDINLYGYIAEVCQKEGCWLKLTTNKGGDDFVFVKMKDHAFLIPKDAAGKAVLVNGTVAKKMQSVAEQKHYLEDAGASAAEISAVTAPKAIFQMQATGLKIYDPTK